MLTVSINKWDLRWLELASHIAEWSKDPSTKVGAVIASNKQLLGTGYNGFPPRITDNPDNLNNREIKYSMVIHAELNAILSAYKQGHQKELLDAILYTTLPPCAECSKIISAAGLKAVYYPEQRAGRNGSKYGELCEDGRRVLSGSGIMVIEVSKAPYVGKVII